MDLGRGAPWLPAAAFLGEGGSGWTSRLWERSRPHTSCVLPFSNMQGPHQASGSSWVMVCHQTLAEWVRGSLGRRTHPPRKGPAGHTRYTGKGLVGC